LLAPDPWIAHRENPGTGSPSKETRYRILGTGSCLRACRQFVRWGERSPWAIPAFTDGFTPPKVERDVPAFLSRAQLAALLEHVKGEPIERAIALAGVVGLRGREWPGGRMRDVNFTTGKLAVRGKGNKRGRVLPLAQRPLRLLELDRGADGPLAGSEFDAHPGRSLQALRRVCEGAGVPVVTWRGLRHTCGTLLAGREPLFIVQRWLGHSKLSTTQIYLHAQEDDLVAAVESVL